MKTIKRNKEGQVVLTPRQRQVMMRHAAGMRGTNIARELGLSTTSNGVYKIIRRPECREWLNDYFERRENAVIRMTAMLPLIAFRKVEFPVDLFSLEQQAPLPSMTD